MRGGMGHLRLHLAQLLADCIALHAHLLHLSGADRLGRDLLQQALLILLEGVELGRLARQFVLAPHSQ